MNWRPLSENPASDEPVTALIATRDDEDGELFLMGIYLWRGGRWVNEDHFRPLPSGEYWYALEAEVLGDLKASIPA